MNDMVTCGMMPHGTTPMAWGPCVRPHGLMHGGKSEGVTHESLCHHHLFPHQFEWEKEFGMMKKKKKGMREKGKGKERKEKGEKLNNQ